MQPGATNFAFVQNEATEGIGAAGSFARPIRSPQA
jgi:hypothetical protein